MSQEVCSGVCQTHVLSFTFSQIIQEPEIPSFWHFKLYFSHDAFTWVVLVSSVGLYLLINFILERGTPKVWNNDRASPEIN